MKTALKQKLSLGTQSARKRLVLVAVAVGVFGALIVLITRAATTSVQLEAESAAITGTASTVDDGTASGGKALHFGQVTTNPNPNPGGGAGIAWPLKISSDKRHLVDQNNKPFLYVADTAWSLLEYNQLDDIKRYIDIRKSQGFTTIQTNVIWDLYNKQGTQYNKPMVGNDFTKPNEAYWSIVDQAMDYAQSKDILLVTGTLWFSKHGAWEANGPAPSAEDFATYSTWLGQRYKDQGNLIWVIGGDDETWRMPEIKNAGANALNAADPNHLITYHPREPDYGFSNEPWHDYNEFQANTNDLGDAPHVLIKSGLEQFPNKPIIDAEPAYYPGTCCGSDRNTTEQKNRRNGWWAILAGGMGVVFGGGGESWGVGWNGTNWDQYTLPAPGHTANINKILSQYGWDKLVPDWDSATVTGDRGSGADYVIAGRADDGSLIVAYTPSERTLNVDLSKLSGPGTAQWYDPTTATTSGSPQSVTNSGSQSFQTPGNNAGGDGDWVLVIKKN